MEYLECRTTERVFFSTLVVHTKDIKWLISVNCQRKLAHLVTFMVGKLWWKITLVQKRQVVAPLIGITHFILKCLENLVNGNYCIPGQKSGILRIQYGHATATEISFRTR